MSGGYSGVPSEQVQVVVAWGTSPYIDRQTRLKTLPSASVNVPIPMTVTVNRFVSGLLRVVVAELRYISSACGLITVIQPYRHPQASPPVKSPTIREYCSGYTT